MGFETIRYLEWFKTKPKARIDLCRSGEVSLLLKDLDIEMEGLDISGENPYGYPSLIEAVAQKYNVKEENVVITLGTSQALYVVCAACLERGEEVFIETPVYEPLQAVPRVFDARIKRFERKFKEKYTFDLDELSTSLSPETRLILLTNLHNPSAAYVPLSFLKTLARIAEKKGTRVVVDEIYLDFLKGKQRETSFHLSDSIIVISSLTKVYGLGGLRCGWILAPSKLVKRMRRILDYIQVEGVFIGEKISSEVFGQLDLIQNQNEARNRQNKARVKRFIQDEERLSWVEPAGGVICFPRVEGEMGGDKLAEALLRDFDTAVVPGSFFEAPEHFRLGFGVDPEILARGLDNIKKALKKL